MYFFRVVKKPNNEYWNLLKTKILKMIVLGESCVAFVLRWSSPESNINSWPPSTFPLFSQDTCGDDDDNCDDDEKTEPMTWARLTWYNAMCGMHIYSEKWPQHKTLPKVQRTRGIEYFQSRSFNKLWDFGQTSAWFCLTKGDKNIEQLWEIHTTTLKKACNSFGKSM